MSRRVNPSADKAAQNQATLKQLVKLEGNKSCADCKKNKHPRWASWNLGIFVCIRCSGIHRGMGTHISRVKSVDLDAWTDEQLQSMIRWGNARANKYWEAKLAPGHVPAENKIENFIRTKYDSKRWVMDGPMPDPSTLQTADDDVPLNVVQEKAKLDRAASMRNGSSGLPLPARPAPQIDLFGDEPSRPARPSTTEPVRTAQPGPGPTVSAPPKQTKPNDSLLGLDFFGGSQSAVPPRPVSAASSSLGGLPQRTDLKQSILSLYASVPKPSAPPQQTGAQSLGGLGSSQASVPSSNGLDDAFSSLNFGPAQPVQAKPSAFSSLTSTASPRQAPSMSSPPAPSGGTFFDPKPIQVQSKPATQRQPSGFGDFGDFTSGAVQQNATKPSRPTTSTMGDLFDLTEPTPTPQPAPSVSKPAAPKANNPPPINMSSYTTNSAFNLSSPTMASQPAKPSTTTPNYAAMSNPVSDPWGSDNAWNTPDPEPAKPAPRQTMAPAPPPVKAPATTSMADDFGGWGSNDSTSNSKPVVTQDDDFGGWSSASPVATMSTQPAASAPSKPASKPFSAGDDLFDNVWG